MHIKLKKFDNKKNPPTFACNNMKVGQHCNRFKIGLPRTPTNNIIWVVVVTLTKSAFIIYS